MRYEEWNNRIGNTSFRISFGDALPCLDGDEMSILYMRDSTNSFDHPSVSIKTAGDEISISNIMVEEKIWERT